MSIGFRIRNKDTGEFFYPGSYKKWRNNGKFYRTIGHARSAFRQIMESQKINRGSLEIVEYEIVEKGII